MKKIIVFLLLVFLIIISGCIQNNKDENKITQLVVSTLYNEKQEFENKTGDAMILIKNNSFDPQTLEVKVGTYVSWENLDDKKHRIVTDDRSFWTPELLPYEPGARSGTTKKFKQVGTFTYRCTIHPEMVGTLIIKEDLPEVCGDNFCSRQEQQNSSCPQDCEKMMA